MAAQITHIIAGEEALERAAPETAAYLLGAAGPYFRLGCQGPDIFYHNQRTKPSGLHYGALAHRRDYGRIIAGALSALSAGESRFESPAGAYLLGLSTHAALDRATHPFVVYFAGWRDPAVPGSERYRGCHPFLERLLDVGLLAFLRAAAPSQYDLENLLSPNVAAGDDARRAIAAEKDLVVLWAAGLRAAYPRSAGGDFLLERRIENALADSRYFYRITNPAITARSSERDDWFGYLDDRAGPRSVALVYPDALPPGIDPMNLGHGGWEHPSGDGRFSSASYPELVEAGIEEAAAIIKLLIPTRGSAPSLHELAQAVGNGGLSVNDLEGRPVAPRLCRPLPLLELMEAEYRRRLDWAKSRSSRH